MKARLLLMADARKKTRSKSKPESPEPDVIVDFVFDEGRKLPGRAKYPNITFKWGVTDSHELYDWHRAVLQGQIQRKDGAIILLDDSGTPKV